MVELLLGKTFGAIVCSPSCLNGDSELPRLSTPPQFSETRTDERCYTTSECRFTDVSLECLLATSEYKWTDVSLECLRASAKNALAATTVRRSRTRW